MVVSSGEQPLAIRGERPASIRDGRSAREAFASTRCRGVANTSVYVTRSPGALYSQRAAPYQRIDARWTRFFDTRSGRVSLFVDVYNVLNNANERERLTTLDFTRTGIRYSEQSRISLPRIPSFGINWEF